LLSVKVLTNKFHMFIALKIAYFSLKAKTTLALLFYEIENINLEMFLWLL
jgi:hypothetical protein